MGTASTLLFPDAEVLLALLTGVAEGNDEASPVSVEYAAPTGCAVGRRAPSSSSWSRSGICSADELMLSSSSRTRTTRLTVMRASYEQCLTFTNVVATSDTCRSNQTVRVISESE